MRCGAVRCGLQARPAEPANNGWREGPWVVVRGGQGKVLEVGSWSSRMWSSTRCWAACSQRVRGLGWVGVGCAAAIGRAGSTGAKSSDSWEGGVACNWDWRWRRRSSGGIGAGGAEVCSSPPVERYSAVRTGCSEVCWCVSVVRAVCSTPHLKLMLACSERCFDSSWRAQAAPTTRSSPSFSPHLHACRASSAPATIRSGSQLLSPQPIFSQSTDLF